MATSGDLNPPPNALDSYSLPVLSPLYGEPPFEYRNSWSQLYVFKSDPQLIRSLVPEPLVPNPDGLMILTLSEFMVSGFGSYKEAILCAVATFEGEPVNHLRRDIAGEDSATSKMAIWGKRRAGVARP